MTAPDIAGADHADAWPKGLNVAFKALSCRSVRRAKDAPDVLRVVACHLLRTGNADHRHRSPIDAQRTPSNAVLLGPTDPESVVLAGLTEFERAGAELPRRADGVIGFEMVAQAPAGADDARFWGCIVRWLRDTYPVPLLAVVHRDQRAPHLHAVVLALLDGKPAGREMQRGAFGFPALRRSFFNRVREETGLRADRPRRTLAELAASPGRGPRTRAEAARRDLEELRRAVPAGEWVGAMSIPIPGFTPEKANVQNCAGSRPLPDSAERALHLRPTRTRRPAPKTADFWRGRRPPAVLELPSCSPSAKTIPDQPNIAMPSPALNSPSQARAQIALTTRQPITQDVSDRAIAHITTGGLGKI